MEKQEMADKAAIRLNKACTIGSGESVISFYNNWAKDYEKDHSYLGYNGYETGAKKLVEFLKQYQFGNDCKILDVGSGTGLGGEVLRKLNFTNVDGLEPSAVLSNVAREKGVYKQIFEVFLAPGDQMPMSSDDYDAALCTGVFIPGHVKAEGAMDEMVRVVKPGGLICFTIREDVFNEDSDHQAMMTKLCDEGAWKQLHASRIQHCQKNIVNHSQLYVFQVL